MKKIKKIPLGHCCDRSKCPLTNTLDLIGDKWTLLIIRDMFFVGKKQFGDFMDSPEGISTNILTDRLKRLEASGLIDKKAYQKKPLRYEYSLTRAGKDLQPVMESLSVWGLTYIESTERPSPKQLKELQDYYKGKNIMSDQTE